jgi:dCMP deaminase
MRNLDDVYLASAFLRARKSYGKRLKVGAVLVTKNGVEIGGYNGTPPGRSNELEYTDANGQLVTKREVIHAELNCILKAAREGVSVKDSTVYITHSPCENCAAMMITVGISKVVYRLPYKTSTGLDMLESAGIVVEKHEYPFEIFLSDER